VLRRSGFTLVELLVVIAIIGVLIGMMLPAVQTVRETSRRASCLSRISQLGKAVLAYETNMGSLPASGMVDRTPVNLYQTSGGSEWEIDMRSGKMFSWIVLILPQLGHEPLYNDFDQSKSVLDQSPEVDPQAREIPELLCPSDWAHGQYFVHPELTAGRRFAKGNYAAFVSPFHTDMQDKYPGALGKPKKKLSEITDGLSHTLLLSEVRARAHEEDQRGAWALPWSGASALAFDMHHVPWLPNTTYTPWKLSLGWTQTPNHTKRIMDMLYSCPDMAGAQMDGMPCGVWAPSGIWHFLSAAPRSRHPRGVNAFFLDGHGGFLPNDIDEYVMAYLVSANDAQVVDVGDYRR